MNTRNIAFIVPTSVKTVNEVTLSLEELAELNEDEWFVTNLTQFQLFQHVYQHRQIGRYETFSFRSDLPTHKPHEVVTLSKPFVFEGEEANSAVIVFFTGVEGPKIGKLSDLVNNLPETPKTP